MISFMIDPKIVSVFKRNISQCCHETFPLSIKVPGRMGLLVTLFLISVNVYNSVDGPPQRGMSYVEVWILCTQLPLIIGLVEYGIILMMMKVDKVDYEDTRFLAKCDTAALIFVFAYYVVFQITYWTVAMM